jgi:hypothetical protein
MRSPGILLVFALCMVPAVGLLACGDESVCTPYLISPEEGEVLDNGCSDFSDEATWHFDWTDCGSPENYHLYVIGQNAVNPAIDRPDLISSSYTVESSGYIADADRFGWRWRVRAKVDGKWSDWSNERTFDVEPLDTDCAP